jgi:hypothetical protein
MGALARVWSIESTLRSQTRKQPGTIKTTINIRDSIAVCKLFTYQAKFLLCTVRSTDSQPLLTLVLGPLPVATRQCVELAGFMFPELALRVVEASEPGRLPRVLR